MGKTKISNPEIKELQIKLKKLNEMITEIQRDLYKLEYTNELIEMTRGVDMDGLDVHLTEEEYFSDRPQPYDEDEFDLKVDENKKIVWVHIPHKYEDDGEKFINGFDKHPGKGGILELEKKGYERRYMKAIKEK